MNVYNISHVHGKVITIKFLRQEEALMVTIDRGTQNIQPDTHLGEHKGTVVVIVLCFVNSINFIFINKNFINKLYHYHLCKHEGAVVVEPNVAATDSLQGGGAALHLP